MEETKQYIYLGGNLDFKEFRLVRGTVYYETDIIKEKIEKYPLLKKVLIDIEELGKIQQNEKLFESITESIKEEIKGKTIKICYRFKKKPDVFLWKNTYHIFKEKISFFQKLKKFFKLWLIKYHYYFDIIYLNKDKRKSILNNDMILTFKVYTHKESIVQMFRYRKATNKVKFSQKEENKTDVEKDTKLSSVWNTEIKDEELENISYRKD